MEQVADGASPTGVIVGVEHLGPETIVEIGADGLGLTARGARLEGLGVDDPVAVRLSAEKLLAFSSDGARLRR
ncbi:hypothetical protein GCM10008179_19480 [Hansschlegelia plantiphila]|uniref:TOBE domain-containing protein n=1 Tax=Hansschlegelia plantiphila TaxID=374655 RepID=A0A9W6J031_9HYPH|nr:hypothetical protein GCM10008179_19480 [Hansschlegelia plantiphila]